MRKKLLEGEYSQHICPHELAGMMKEGSTRRNRTQCGGWEESF